MTIYHINLLFINIRYTDNVTHTTWFAEVNHLTSSYIIIYNGALNVTCQLLLHFSTLFTYQLVMNMINISSYVTVVDAYCVLCDVRQGMKAIHGQSVHVSQLAH